MTWKRSALLVLICLTASAQARIPIILDTDLGDSIDDALALAFALRSPELDVRAVTTVIDDVESKTRLAWKMLGVYNRRDISLAMGAPEPLLDPTMTTASKEFEVLTRNDTIPDAARRRASDVIIDTVLQSRGKITLVAIGPLTNIALALKTDPRIKNSIERIVIMGGAYLSSEAEYNIKRDRAAAEIVFHSGVPITAVGLDVTSQCKLREKDLDRLRLANDPDGNFLVRLIDLAEEQTHDANPTLYDPLAIAAIFRPDLLEMQSGTVDVPLSGTGQTIFQAEAGAKTQVAVRVNAPAFLDLFADRVTRGSSALR
ncbi:MAG: Inosine/uridine-preferring nucleoside hydrolase [Bryobacterales bacterium]|nr:Inosine/uridine-preferring nucleoside hydrolase [Bryobacterales bacterium]